MPAFHEEHLAPLIQDAVRAARKDCAPSNGGKYNGALAGRFVEDFYANVSPSDLVGEASETLAKAALSLLDFAETRKAHTAKIRIRNSDDCEANWRSVHTAIEIINDDMPFLVDSITAALNHMRAEVRLVIHPIIPIERDEAGKLVGIASYEDAEMSGLRGESCMLIQINEQPEARHAAIAERLTGVLKDVRAAVEDWRIMRERCRELIREIERTPPKLPRPEIAEGIAFLEWLNDENFTFLGYREYSFQGKGKSAVARIDPDAGLGLLRETDYSVFDGLRNLGQLPSDVQAWVKSRKLLRIVKGNRRSTVHRDAHVDGIAVKKFDAKGQVIGERLFIGLFTSQAYSRSPRAIPLLRKKVDGVLQSSGFPPNSHDYKSLQHVLETYPRDELFQISTDELRRISSGIVHLQERQRTALFVRRDLFERFVSCLVFVPRDRFDARLRTKVQDILAEAFHGRISAFYTFLGEMPLVRLHFIVKTEQGNIPHVDLEALEETLAEAARSWTDGLRVALFEDHGERDGLELFERYERAFPISYQEKFHPKDAVADIRSLQLAADDNRLALDLYRPHKAEQEVVHLKVYDQNGPLALSDVLPILEHMGLKVISEVPFQVTLPYGGPCIWVQDFNMRLRSGAGMDIEHVREAFHEVFQQVWNGRMEDDGFNGLVLSAGLSEREIKVLRAYSKYLRQVGIPFSQDRIEEALASHPVITAHLAELFELRFEPIGKKGKTVSALKEKALAGEILGMLDSVTSLDDDRILRRYLNLIQNTLRTNYYQLAEDGSRKDYISFKLDSRDLEDLPEPKPYREIFVYSPQVEGVHLRFGPVARGGLRWSDRREDFRTEVLGLVKAQQVKNAVIVPVGSKGGFVPKRLPPPEAGREAWMAEGIASYKTFIRGLLDLTDNIKDGKIVPPKQVVRYDGDDPYLVVAADKGTATFSDIANGVSADYGFWLDDAFASGGSAGYDHKAMGITARGAWESVKRHFREMGKNIQEEEFSVIGVGDMSGDVFGNGMLLSKKIKLIAAFNHLHIFVDPDPDSAKSWKERKRLFDLPRSSWTDYKSSLISKGGGIFDRKAKSIDISPEMRKLFGLHKDKATPNQLIHAILQSHCDLLWFGGIGTYVKAREESQAEAGDRANDAIRVDADELNCAVVGEGANLGMTQRARIAFGLRGGRLNTDSIDNSAGVDCSDHEVNIKILLGEVERSGRMSRKQRDNLLERMTDEVAALVLRDNYLQSQAITITHTLGHHLLDRLVRFMRSLERAGKLNRAIEFLPDDETIEERHKAGIGLTRPETAVLLSYAKIDLYDELLGSALPDDPYMVESLERYFPEPLQKKYVKDIRTHQLSREIIATQATNSVINRLGITFVHEVREKTGMDVEEIGRACVATREILDLRERWAEIEALDNKVPASTQAAMLVECGRLCERLVVWLLREESHPLDITGCVKRYRAGARELAANLAELLSPKERRVFEQKAKQFSDDGVPKALAEAMAGFAELSPIGDVVRCAEQCKLPVRKAATAYFKVGERFGFDSLRRASKQLPSDSAWDKLAVTAIVDDLYAQQYELTTRVLDGGNCGKVEPAKAIEAWAETRPQQVRRSDQLLAELETTSPDLAMLAVANRQLKSMVG